MTSVRSQSPSGSLTGKFARLTMSDHPPACEKHKNDIKVDYFYGDKAKLRAFLVQLKLAYALNPEKYPDSRTKVLLAAAYLRGSAFAWFEPFVSDYLEHAEEDREPDTKAMFKKYSTFEEKLKQVFGVFDEERAAARMVHQLKQRGSAAQYYSDRKSTRLNSSY